MKSISSLCYAHALVFLSVTLILVAAMPTPASKAAELPPVSLPIFIQTNGASADIGLGDWYSSDQNGFGGGYHYLGIEIPCRWPSTLDVHIDLFSPEINTFAPPPRIDEVGGATLSDTVFELYDQHTPYGGLSTPGPGAPGSLIQLPFTPVTGQAEQWVRFYTLPAPVACGTYLLRAETLGDDQNGWRLRVGHDNDSDPNNAMPANYDNPDGSAGTGDELAISIEQTTYQHNELGQVECLLNYQYVRPNLPDVSFHNFDLDNNERVTYYPPSATLDLQGNPAPGSIAGTVSGSSVWNGGTQTSRGTGDVVLNPEPGWWRLVTCVKDDNQFNQEGQTGVPSFLEPVPEPDMAISKDNQRTLVSAGDVLTYTIRFSNNSPTTKQVPGAAFDVMITDTLPLSLGFLSCRLMTPGLSGSCANSGQDVTFTLDDPVFAGASGEVEVVAEVQPGASGQVLNVATMDYTDLLGNPRPTERAEDLDLIPAAAPLPSIVVDKTASLSRDNNGDGKADPADEIAYTISITNTGPTTATGVLLRDAPDANTTLVIGTVAIDPAGGLVLHGNSLGDRYVEAQIGMIAPGDSAQVSFTARVNNTLLAGTTTIANQAVVRGDNVPDTPSDDPSTPEPDDPTDVPAGGSPGGGPPTAITLTDFRVVTDKHAVTVLWSTGSEIRTVGFEILRAATADQAGAVRLGPIIPAQGVGGGGASYRYADSSASPDETYYYWLVERESGGAASRYGPVARPATAADAGGYQVYLPLAIR
ncbi:DUF11 domain-containing protein [Oscillochloris sp. ZM17-4]|uniref:DUF11 domain-containing protein n=1 Tax=Oscillochloris sp. ZM17-4 TaxID=2866714 RepID=UPI001C73220D|nr:DUF11 domain-containing protein [Oscillochloris sp. ZM17-4]MBX0327462.1 DUF11 domain-containing protein [Oscillochloris sp. ZM17-4]